MKSNNKKEDILKKKKKRRTGFVEEKLWLGLYINYIGYKLGRLLILGKIIGLKFMQLQ